MTADPRIIVALDTPTGVEGEALVKQLGAHCSFYKIGLELIAAGEGIALAQQLIGAGKDIFIDLKLLDIPATVAGATRRVSSYGARFLTVHAQEDALKAAVDASHATGILAVTVLTSVNTEVHEQQGSSLTEQVVAASVRAVELGCAGVVCSPQEAQAVRAAVGEDCVIVTPGIRAKAMATNDDQQRTATAAEALELGADHLVIGRPIRNAENPLQALQEIQATLT